MENEQFDYRVTQPEDGRHFETDKIVIEKLGEDKPDRYNEVYALDGTNLRKNGGRGYPRIPLLAGRAYS